MAGFTFRKNLDGGAYVPSLLYTVGKNSIIFTVGDAIRVNTSGFSDLATANEKVIGFVASVVDSNGIKLDPDSGTTNTWTMESDNETVNGYQVSYIPAFAHYAWSTDSDTTIELSSIGKYFNINSTSDGIVTSGESDTLGTLMFQLIGTDPDGDSDVSKGLYMCVATQMGASAQGNRGA